MRNIFLVRETVLAELLRTLRNREGDTFKRDVFSQSGTCIVFCSKSPACSVPCACWSRGDATHLVSRSLVLLRMVSVDFATSAGADHKL
jgi:hypothetical protein